MKDYISEILFSAELIKTKEIASLKHTMSRLKSYIKSDTITNRYISQLIAEDLEMRQHLISQLELAFYHSELPKEPIEDDLDGVECDGILLHYKGIDLQDLLQQWTTVCHLEMLE